MKWQIYCGVLFILLLAEGVVTQRNEILRPRYPEMFISNWTYTLASANNIISSGWTLWAGYNQSMYYYMSALDGWEQLLTGTSIYNFYRTEENCCVDNYGWPLFANYFNNATLMGYSKSGEEEVVEWVGSLYTQPIFSSNVTYFVKTAKATGYPLAYISANVVNYNASEIMYLLNISYSQPPLSLFLLPSFCLSAPPCSH